MTEYEWEPRRVPRPNSPQFLADHHRRAREVAEFLALEHPREHVGWILRQHAQSRTRPAGVRWKRKVETGPTDDSGARKSSA
jgi:hypothetical protein